jgi:phenylacetate-CoA ligase
MKEKIYKIAPHFIQNLMVSVFNLIAYKYRYGGNYKKHLEQKRSLKSASLIKLQEFQQEKLTAFLKFSKQQSKYYAQIDENTSVHSIATLPIITKEILRAKINDIYTLDKSKGIVAKTGGTTGASLEVVFTKDNIQERFAAQDAFREQFGYKLGEKSAWFSGKSIITSRDVKRNRFWKTDVLHNIRYYSTFHIKKEYLEYFLKNLIAFKPKYLIGFPTSMVELASFGLNNNIIFPARILTAIFPTAETVTPHIRNILESYFKCNVYNQYASSEGAPFIFECKKRKLHVDLSSGVFEVLDEKNKPAQSGKLVFTSFTTYGTPLIRYDIGDSIALSKMLCSCGNNNPLVDEILGRANEYVFSPENGKINLVNVANTLKDTFGIQKIQVIQNQLDAISLNIVIDETKYTRKSEDQFLRNWRDRVGLKMKIDLCKVKAISSERSGKYRIVINNVTSLID